MVMVVMVMRMMVDLCPVWSIPRPQKALFILIMPIKPHNVRDPVHYWIDARCSM